MPHHPRASLRVLSCCSAHLCGGGSYTCLYSQIDPAIKYFQFWAWYTLATSRQNLGRTIRRKNQRKVSAGRLIRHGGTHHICGVATSWMLSYISPNHFWLDWPCTNWMFFWGRQSRRPTRSWVKRTAWISQSTRTWAEVKPLINAQILSTSLFFEWGKHFANMCTHATPIN